MFDFPIHLIFSRFALAIVSMNKEVINKYLSVDIDFPQDIDFVRNLRLLPVVEPDAARHKISCKYPLYFYPARTSNVLDLKNIVILFVSDILSNLLSSRENISDASEKQGKE